MPITSWTREGVTTTSDGGPLTLSKLTVDDIVVDGTNIGHTNDLDLLVLSSGTLTVNGSLNINTINAASGDLTITAAGGDISFGDENLSTTGFMCVGTASREGTGMLTVHGSAPSIWLTSTQDLEGGQINIKGTAGGGGGEVDYGNNRMYLDMWKTYGRILFQGKNLTAEDIVAFRPDVINADNNTLVSTYIKHIGNGKICLKGSGTNASSHDQVNIGEGGDKDQTLIFHGSAATSYAGNDATDDKFHMGTGSTMGSNKRISFDTNGVGFNGQTPAAAPDWTVSNKLGTPRALNANGTLAEIGDNLAQLVDDLISIGILQ